MSTPIEGTAVEALKPLVLVTGASGYVGGRLVPRLLASGSAVRCLARKPEELRKRLPEGVETVKGDVFDPPSLEKALAGVHTAYYLVHSMSGTDDFERKDRQGAIHFATAACQAKVRRIVYVGGLGDDAPPDAKGKKKELSPHLRSRHEVGRILRESGTETIEFRAAMVLGAGSLSYQLMKSLTDRLPVMLCPTWLRTPTQPIAIEDLLAYLLAARDLPAEGSRVYEIGGANIVSYGDLIQEYARQKQLRRLLIYIPLLTPYLSGLWLSLVTPTKFEVGRHLIEGLKNPMVVRDDSALKAFPDIHPLGMRDAMQAAIAGEEEG